MSYRATVFQILIAGPGDASDFKDLAHRLIHNWNSANARQRGVVMMPRRWEQDSLPTYGLHPQVAINGQLVDDADGMIAIFRDQLGTPTESNVSGTVEELDRVNAAGHQVMMYVFDGPVSRERATTESFKKLEKFKRELRTKGLYQSFTDERQLESRLAIHLAQLGNRFAADSAIPSASVDSAPQALSHLRSTVGRRRRLWRSEKDSEPPGVSDGKAILATLKNDLASVDSGDDEETGAALQEISSRIARLQRHQLYIDGGRSYQEFWDGGDEILGSLDSLINQLERLDEAEVSVPLASTYRDVQLSARLDFMPTGPCHYDLDLVTMNFRAINYGQHSANAIQFDLESDPPAGFLKYPRSPLSPGEQMTIEFSFPRGERIDGEDQTKNEVHSMSVHYEDGVGSHSVGLSLSITGRAPDLIFELTNVGVDE